MITTSNLRKKRELLASGIHRSGLARLLSGLPERDSLIVLNYHRIGDSEDDPYLEDVFSATANQFEEQVSYLKKHVSVVSLEEALGFIEGESKESDKRCRVLITFDDGYLDNYQIAFPILRAHGVEAVFFLATSLVGSSEVPWWDRIAYAMKTARRHRFTLRYPSELTVDIGSDGLERSLKAVLAHYKQPRNQDGDLFITELITETQSNNLPEASRRFLSWKEAREMAKGGMSIGSHTHSHRVLSQLVRDRQVEELCKSRNIVTEEVGVRADVLAYPVGGTESFTDETQRIAQEAGYRAAFSFYGGVNGRKNVSPYDVRRVFIGPQSARRFQVQTEVCRHLGKFWP